MASPDPGAGPDKASLKRVFVFNGDADGLVAQHILGMEIGAPDLRVTGGKRDIELLAQVPPLVSGHIYAMDISLRRNLDALGRLMPLLSQGNLKITWYDHHEPGEPPADANIVLHINQAPETCTAAIVNAVHGLRHPLWAAMAAFGDNLPATASALASSGGASSHEAALLRRVGVLINYNAYGEKPGDRFFEPADLATRMAPFVSALDFCWEASIIGPLAAQFDADRDRFQDLTALVDAPGAQAFLVPDEPFARRYGATWANERILQQPGIALAVLHPRIEGGYQVSIRAPRDWSGRASVGFADPGTGTSSAHAPSAADLAKEFPTGGGRKLAAGIDALPADQLGRFTERFRDFFGS
ncbi:MAG: acetyltransferase [Fibrobacterota bacterium]|nr:acetyltransferase [Fibrobacterota bacterium]